MKTWWRLLAAVFAVLAATEAFAGGNKEPPVLREYPTEAAYLSPNGDGVQEEAKLDFTVTLRVKSRQGYVPVYGLQVKKAGVVVRDVKVATERSDIGWFMRLFSGYTEFTLRRSLQWDGKDDEGRVVPDGVYEGSLYVVDANGNRTDIKVGDFVVDTVAPSATVSAESLFFSPNGDGNRDELLLRQSGSSEDLWEGRILDASGATVRAYQWRNGPPADQAWDGRADSGALAADGTYSYVLTAVDRAGNKSSVSPLTNIVLDTRPTPIRVAVEPPYFSPNGDGRQDVATLLLAVDSREGIVGWKVAVRDALKQEVWSRSGSDDRVPESLAFDGRDAAGRMLPDGSYTVSFRVDYRNGNAPEVLESLHLDNTPPSAALVLDNPSFSPVGRKNQVTVRLDASEPVTWQGRFLDPSGRVLIETPPGQTQGELRWNGKGPDGRLLPDGSYGLEVTVTDLAGNSASVPRTLVTLDTVAPRVEVALDTPIFSPNGDGIRDTVTVTVRASEPVTGTLTATDPAGGRIGPVALARFSGEASEVWDGTGPLGQPLPDGMYQVSAAFEDDAGNPTSVGPLAVTLDRRAGQLALEVPDGFSPAAQRGLAIRVVAETYDGVASWSLGIQDLEGRVVKTFAGSGELPREVSWDGRTDSGASAREAQYRARLEASYRSGVRATADSKPFQLDATPPQVTVGVVASPFTRTDDQIEGEAFATLEVKDASPIARWDLEILDKRGESVRSYSGEGDPSGSLVWRGELAASASVPRDYQGNPTAYTESYTVHLTVIDRYENSTTYRRPVPVDVLVLRKDGKMFLLVPNIIFAAYRHELDSRGADFYRRNMESIRRVADLLKRHTQYGIRLEAHAENIYLGRAREEAEEKILYPLTERRAEAVRQALIRLGVPAERITTAAYGGKHPIADVRDPRVYWKNRRVEFLLVPQP